MFLSGIVQLITPQNSAAREVSLPSRSPPTVKSPVNHATRSGISTLTTLTTAALVAVALVTAWHVSWMWDARLATEGSGSSHQSGATSALPRQERRDDHRSGDRHGPVFPIEIRHPQGDLGILVSHPHDETAVRVACATCHATRQPDLSNRATADLTEFHQMTVVDHGSISCLSCHHPEDYGAFRLADGQQLAYRDVMQLCAQCHSQQKRDYDHGVHGGMIGHWDRQFGPQYKHNCIDCHAPHQPKFPAMQATFKPQDRFLAPPRNSRPHSPGH